MALKHIVAAAALLLGSAAPALAQSTAITEDPGRPHVRESLEGKKVIMVPMSAGFDLAQGWAHYIGDEVKSWGGTFEVRDPNWDVGAGAQAITDAISAKPAVLIVMNPDLQSYVKLMKRAQSEGIYVVQIDNRSNLPTEVFAGSDWVRLGQLEAEAVLKGCGEGTSKHVALIQGDQVNASSLDQYAGIKQVLDKHPDISIVAQPDSNWDATTAKNVATTVVQQHPEVCGIIDFWDGTVTGTAAAVRDAKLTGKVYVVTTGGGEQVDCDMLNDGSINAIVSTDVPQQSHNINAAMKSAAAERHPGRPGQELAVHQRDHHDQGRHQARHLLEPEGDPGQEVTAASPAPTGARGPPHFGAAHPAPPLESACMGLREALTRLRYNAVPDHLIGEVLTKRWTDNAVPLAALLLVVFGFGSFVPGFFTLRSAVDALRQLGEFSIVVVGLTVVMLGGGIDLSVGAVFALGGLAAVGMIFIAGEPVWLALLAAVGVGIAAGALNGLLDRLHAAAGVS